MDRPLPDEPLHHGLPQQARRKQALTEHEIVERAGVELCSLQLLDFAPQPEQL